MRSIISACIASCTRPRARTAAIDGQEGPVTDQVMSLIGTLYFGSIGEVLDKGEMIFNLETAQTTVRLRTLGEEVELASNVCDPVPFPRQAFLEALVACGERFIALAETLWGDDPDNAVVFASLKASATARAKLTAAFRAR